MAVNGVPQHPLAPGLPDFTICNPFYGSHAILRHCYEAERRLPRDITPTLFYTGAVGDVESTQRRHILPYRLTYG